MPPLTELSNAANAVDPKLVLYYTTNISSRLKTSASKGFYKHRTRMADLMIVDGLRPGAVCVDQTTLDKWAKLRRNTYVTAVCAAIEEVLSAPNLGHVRLNAYKDTPLVSTKSVKQMRVECLDQFTSMSTYTVEFSWGALP